MFFLENPILEKPTKINITPKRSKKNYESKSVKSKKIKLEPDDLNPSSSKYVYMTDEDFKILTKPEENHDSSYEDNFERYPITDPNKPFVCQHCGVSFAREKAMISHSRVRNIIKLCLFLNFKMNFVFLDSRRRFSS